MELARFLLMLMMMVCCGAVGWVSSLMISDVSLKPFVAGASACLWFFLVIILGEIRAAQNGEEKKK